MIRSRWTHLAGVATLLLVGGLAALRPMGADASTATTCSQSVHSDWRRNVWHHNSIAGAGDVDWARFDTASASWGIITLGGLTGDLSLSLYDANCHRLATSQHAGRRFEEIARSLPAGRYYVKISGAASVYDLRFRTLSAGTHVVSSRAYKDADGQLAIAGEVLNNRSSRWFVRDVTATYYDRAGRVIGHGDGAVTQSIEAAHQIRPFLLTDPFPRGYDHYRLNVSTQAPYSNYPNPARTTVQRGPTWRDPNGDVHYPGAVRNDTRSAIFGASVMCTLYDSHGRVRYVSGGSVEPLTVPPSSSGGFDAVFGPVTGVQASLVTVRA